MVRLKNVCMDYGTDVFKFMSIAKILVDQLTGKWFSWIMEQMYS